MQTQLLDLSNPVVQIGLGAAVLALALLVWLSLRRRRRKGTFWDPATLKVIESVRASHPHFHAILSDFARSRRPSELLRHEEARKAFERLSELKGSSGGRERMLHLSASDQNSSRRVDAALVTILKTIYFDPQLRSALSPESEKATDELLEELTGA